MTALGAKRDPNAKRKPMRKAKPGVGYTQAKQRSALRGRSGGLCEFLVPELHQEWNAGKMISEFIFWVRCKKPTSHACHVIPRANCGKARDLLDVVVDGCEECHDVYDGRAMIPRHQRQVPLKYRRAAYAAVVAAEKTKKADGSTTVPQKFNPDASVV